MGNINKFLLSSKEYCRNGGGGENDLKDSRQVVAEGSNPYPTSVSSPNPPNEGDRVSGPDPSVFKLLIMHYLLPDKS
jgi:hypothetical protein